MDEKINKMIDALLIGTRNKEFQWEVTPRASEFRLTLEAGSVTVDSWTAQDEDTGEEIDLADIVFNNVKGERIDRYWAQGGGGSAALYERLVGLHEAVRRNAMRLDEALNDIFGEVSRRVKK